MFDLLAQLDPEAIKSGKEFMMAFPAIGGILIVTWLNHRANERRDARDRDATALREQVWVDVAKQTSRLSQEGQRLQEKTLDFIKDASASLSQARDSFERNSK